MHGEYLKYGKAFGESIGRRRGGVAKVVGRVVGGEEGGWDEVALGEFFFLACVCVWGFSRGKCSCVRDVYVYVYV